MKKFIGLFTVFLFVAAGSAAVYDMYMPDYAEPRTVETENYRIHFVERYGETSGKLQALVRVDEGEKREMILAYGTDPSTRETCKNLYRYSRTRYPSPCSKIPDY